MVKLNCPNIMCIGAAKSGTTSLFNILRQHPDIYSPSFKEPHFFDVDENYKKGLDWYESTYYKDCNKKISIDYTPSYFFNSKAPKRIFNAFGRDMKFVLILRNPIDRAYSHYLHSKRDEEESLTFLQAVAEEDKRLYQYSINNNNILSLRHSYYNQGLYGVMMERYLEYFSLENFFIIDFENEFIKNRKVTIDNLMLFMGLASFDFNLDHFSNPSSKSRIKFLKKLLKKQGWWNKVVKMIIPSLKYRQIIRNRIQSLNTKPFIYDELPEKIKKSIYMKYFKNDIFKFEQLVNKKFDWHQKI